PSTGVLDLMVALERGEWDYTVTTSDAVRKQASGLVAAHLQWHLERQLRTLPLIERSHPHQVPLAQPDSVFADTVGQDGDRDSTTRAATPA
ncbi:MAG: DNA repair protein RecO, partial [Rhodococcus sp. (in: high G+C Gram-positive bacteria)]